MNIYEKTTSIFAKNVANVTKIAPAMNYTVKVVGGEVNITVALPAAINGNLTVTYPSGFVENVTIKNGKTIGLTAISAIPNNLNLKKDLDYILNNVQYNFTTGKKVNAVAKDQPVQKESTPKSNNNNSSTTS